MPNRTMEAGADRWIVDRFQPYYEQIEFYSWVREPDFCPDYRAQWERDKQLSVNTLPERFELASFWRLVRDPDYVHFLKDVGVHCVQLTLFGLRDMTDRYVGRKGAFDEILRATEMLLENGIAPRWQAFINMENRNEIVELLRLSEKLKLKERTERFDGTFRFFVHAGSCDGENRRLYPIRIEKGQVPEELIPYFLNYEENRSEQELCEQLKDDTGFAVPQNSFRNPVVYVSNTYDLFFNFTHMRPEWKIGNLKEDPIEELVRRIEQQDTPALNIARSIPIGELAARYGNPASLRLFEREDYLGYLLNTHLEKLSEPKDFSAFELETEHLKLKKAEEADLNDIYHNLWQHKESAKYMLWDVTESQQAAEDRMQRSIAFQKTHKYAFFVQEKSTGKVIGFAGMREAEPWVYEDTGVALGPDYTQKGYGTEILNAFLKEAKANGAYKLVTTCRKQNVASHALQMKCGMTFSHDEDRIDPRDGSPFVLEFNEKIF